MSHDKTESINDLLNKIYSETKSDSDSEHTLKSNSDSTPNYDNSVNTIQIKSIFETSDFTTGE